MYIYYVYILYEGHFYTCFGRYPMVILWVSYGYPMVKVAASTENLCARHRGAQ